MQGSIKEKLSSFGIAAFCVGYFASYVPLSMMTKMVTKGLYSGMDGKGFAGFEIQPLLAISVFISTYAFITFAGWWKYATHSRVLGISVPRPQWFTFISGICTAGQIITTLLAYTFNGVSIVFAMLLMRGGVLVMAPFVDLVARRKRKIYWPSFAAALLALAALFIAFMGKAGTALTTLCVINILAYLFVYFFRLLFMSNRAKSTSGYELRQYFAEEQMTAVPVLFFSLLIVGLIGSTMDAHSLPGQIWAGFTKIPFTPYAPHILLTGVFSFGIGLFGSLIFLDRRENTFTVPANRVSSIIAGVVATYLLAIFYGQSYPGTHQLIGVLLIIIAIIFLWYRRVIEKRSKECPLKIENECAVNTN